MDTLFVAKNWSNQKLIEIAFYISVVAGLVLTQCLVFSSPLFADDMRLAKATLAPVGINQESIKNKILNEISPEIRENNFNEYIKRKYPNSLIKTVAKGIKHIKMTRYYDGRPVKINVVEVDLKLADNFEIKPALSFET